MLADVGVAIGLDVGINIGLNVVIHAEIDVGIECSDTIVMVPVCKILVPNRDRQQLWK
jgi:hypothetical protein